MLLEWTVLHFNFYYAWSTMNKDVISLQVWSTVMYFPSHILYIIFKKQYTFLIFCCAHGYLCVCMPAFLSACVRLCPFYLAFSPEMIHKLSISFCCWSNYMWLTERQGSGGKGLFTLYSTLGSPYLTKQRENSNFPIMRGKQHIAAGT